MGGRMSGKMGSGMGGGHMQRHRDPFGGFDDDDFFGGGFPSMGNMGSMNVMSSHQMGGPGGFSSF